MEHWGHLKFVVKGLFLFCQFIILQPLLFFNDFIMLMAFSFDYFAAA